MTHYYAGFDIPLLILAILLTMLSATIASMITGERMSWKSIWNSALFTSFIPVIYHIVAGDTWLWLAIIITNVGLFFILPTWWIPMEKDKKTYCYLIFLIFNTVFIIAVTWLLRMFIRGI